MILCSGNRFLPAAFFAILFSGNVISLTVSFDSAPLAVLAEIHCPAHIVCLVDLVPAPDTRLI